MLTTEDHRRDSAGMTYVYPVISRRARGVSVGVNLNVNNACNWACAYCQVEGLTRGGPPPIDLEQLAAELDRFLEDAVAGDFMAKAVPADSRRLVDVAFSGNGEPTSAPEFPSAVRIVRKALATRGLLPQVKIRLITNGSLLHREAVQEGIREIGDECGEIWFKVDQIGEEATRAVNGVPSKPETVRRNLETCAGLATTWVQTCWFGMDGQPPSELDRKAYWDFLRPMAGMIAGIHLYGLARPSLQPGAERLTRLDADAMEAFGLEIQEKTGIKVLVSP